MGKKERVRLDRRSWPESPSRPRRHHIWHHHDLPCTLLLTGMPLSRTHLLLLLVMAVNRVLSNSVKCAAATASFTFACIAFFITHT